MRVFLFFLSLVVVRNANAQAVFCPSGARWVYYNEGEMGSPWNPLVQTEYQYVGDSVINGVSSKKILFNRIWSTFGDQFSSSSAFTFITQRNDSILFYRNGAWELAMDFGVIAGDQRVVAIDANEIGQCPTSDTLIVDSVWTFNYQGLSLRAVDYHILVNDWSFVQYPNSGRPGRYIERIGHLLDGPILDSSCEEQILDNTMVPFLCYSDSELVSMNPEPCAVIIGIPDHEPMESRILMADGILIVSGRFPGTVRLYDLQGRLLLQADHSSHETHIELSKEKLYPFVVSFQNLSGIVNRRIFIVD